MQQHDSLADGYLKVNYARDMEYLRFHKQKLSVKHGRRIYKHVALLDMKGLGWSHIGGEFRMKIQVRTACVLLCVAAAAAAAAARCCCCMLLLMLLHAAACCCLLLLPAADDLACVVLGNPDRTCSVCCSCTTPRLRLGFTSSTPRQYSTSYGGVLCPPKKPQPSPNSGPAAAGLRHPVLSCTFPFVIAGVTNVRSQRVPCALYQGWSSPGCTLKPSRI